MSVQTTNSKCLHGLAQASFFSIPNTSRHLWSSYYGKRHFTYINFQPHSIAKYQLLLPLSQTRGLSLRDSNQPRLRSQSKSMVGGIESRHKSLQPFHTPSCFPPFSLLCYRLPPCLRPCACRRGRRASGGDRHGRRNPGVCTSLAHSAQRGPGNTVSPECFSAGG